MDALYVTYSIVLNISAINEDQYMIALAQDFDAKAIHILELLKIMLVCGYANMRFIEPMYREQGQSHTEPSKLDNT